MYTFWYLVRASLSHLSKVLSMYTNSDILLELLSYISKVQYSVHIFWYPVRTTLIYPRYCSVQISWYLIIASLSHLSKVLSVYTYSDILLELLSYISKVLSVYTYSDILLELLSHISKVLYSVHIFWYPVRTTLLYIQGTVSIHIFWYLVRTSLSHLSKVLYTV